MKNLRKDSLEYKEMMKNRNKLLEKFELTEDEFHLIADKYNGYIPNFSFLLCKSRMLDYIFENDEYYDGHELFIKWEVEEGLFYNKLLNLSYSQTLELFIEVDNFWGDDEEKYLQFRRKSPKKILEEFLQNQSEIDLKYL